MCKTKTKVCKECQNELPFEMFQLNNNNYGNECKECENKKTNSVYEEVVENSVKNNIKIN